MRKHIKREAKSLQLEERLKGKIDAQFKDDVSFEKERETFTS